MHHWHFATLTYCRFTNFCLSHFSVLFQLIFRLTGLKNYWRKNYAKHHEVTWYINFFRQVAIVQFIKNNLTRFFYFTSGKPYCFATCRQNRRYNHLRTVSSILCCTVPNSRLGLKCKIILFLNKKVKVFWLNWYHQKK